MYLQSLTIKGKKYKVYRKDIEGHVLGYCDKYSKKIVINKLTPQDKIVTTLAHEMAHAYIHECYLDQTLDATQEEIICEIVADLVENYVDFLSDLKTMADEEPHENKDSIVARRYTLRR